MGRGAWKAMKNGSYLQSKGVNQEIGKPGKSRVVTRESEILPKSNDEPIRIDNEKAKQLLRKMKIQGSIAKKWE